MIFEAIHPFELSIHGVPVRDLEPGDVFLLDEEHSRKLLAKAPSTWVKVLTTVQWKSPLFSGVLEGRVLLTNDHDILVQHPKIGEPAWIFKSWIIRDPGKGTYAG